MSALPGFQTNHVIDGMRAAQAGKHTLHSISYRYPSAIVFDHVGPSSCPKGNAEEVQNVDKEGQERGNG